MAISGRSINSKNIFKIFPRQYSPGGNYKINFAQLISTSESALSSTPNSSATVAQAGIVTNNSYFDFAKEFETLYLTTKINSTKARILNPNDKQGSKFILRDIGRISALDTKDEYRVRFRILSKDRNRSSAWSPFYVVNSPGVMNNTDSLGLLSSAINPPFLGVEPSFSYTYFMTEYVVSLSPPADIRTLINISWDKIKGLDYVDIYERSLYPTLTNWSYVGRQITSQSVNMIQIWKKTNMAQVNSEFSFNRPVNNPESLTTEDEVIKGRLFLAIKNI